MVPFHGQGDANEDVLRRGGVQGGDNGCEQCAIQSRVVGCSARWRVSSTQCSWPGTTRHSGGGDDGENECWPWAVRGRDVPKGANGTDGERHKKLVFVFTNLVKVVLPDDLVDTLSLADRNVMGES